MRDTHSRYEARNPAAGPNGARLEDRIAQLTDRGILVPPAEPDGLPATVTRRPGSLGRFLAERG